MTGNPGMTLVLLIPLLLWRRIKYFLIMDNFAMENLLQKHLGILIFDFVTFYFENSEQGNIIYDGEPCI